MILNVSTKHKVFCNEGKEEKSNRKSKTIPQEIIDYIKRPPKRMTWINFSTKNSR